MLKYFALQIRSCVPKLLWRVIFQNFEYFESSSSEPKCSCQGTETQDIKANTEKSLNDEKY